MNYLVILATSFFLYVLTNVMLNVLDGLQQDTPSKTQDLYVAAFLVNQLATLVIGFSASILIVQLGAKYLN